MSATARLTSRAEREPRMSPGRAKRSAERRRRAGLRCGAKGHWPKMLETAVFSGLRKPYDWDGRIGYWIARCRECNTRLAVEVRVTTDEELQAVDPEALFQSRERRGLDLLTKELTRGSRW